TLLARQRSLGSFFVEEAVRCAPADCRAASSSFFGGQINMPTSQTTQHQRTTQQHRSNNSNRASSQARSSYQTRFNETTKPVSELFEQAMNSYEQAFRTGLKLQE